MMMFRFQTIFKIRNPAKEEKFSTQTVVARHWREGEREEGDIDIWGDILVWKFPVTGQRGRQELSVPRPDFLSYYLSWPGLAWLDLVCEKIKTCQGYNPIMLIINNIQHGEIQQSYHLVTFHNGIWDGHPAVPTVTSTTHRILGNVWIIIPSHNSTPELSL